MTADEYLKTLDGIRYQIDSTRRQIAALEDMADCLRSPSFDTAVQRSGSGNANFVNISLRIADFKLELENEIKMYQQRYNEITETINKVKDPIAAAVLRYKYVNFLTMEEIAEIINYSVRRTYQFYVAGLDEIDSLLSE